MDAAKQKRILEYFLQETQEHLAILHQALTAMAQPLADAEEVASWFRAAHSIKGGAAMLGLDAVKQMALRLEDCLKILRDQGVARRVQLSPEMVERFRQGVAALEGLVNHLQQEGDIPFEMGQQAVIDQEPNFIQLEALLQILVQGEEGIPAAWEAGATTAQAGDGEELNLEELFADLEAGAAVAEVPAGEAAAPLASAVEELASLAELFSLGSEAAPVAAGDAETALPVEQAAAELGDLANLFAVPEEGQTAEPVGAAATGEAAEFDFGEELGDIPTLDLGAETAADLGGLGVDDIAPETEPAGELPDVPEIPAELSSGDSGLVGDLGVDWEAALAAFANPEPETPTTEQADTDPWQETELEELAALDSEIGALDDLAAIDAELAQQIDTELAELDFPETPGLEPTDASGDLALADLELPDLSEDLSALEAVLTTETTPAEGQPDVTENLDELAKSLGLETQEPAAAPPPPRPTVSEPEPRITASASAPVMEQTMRVPIRQLDNLSNLIGELVVSRNTLSEDQNQLRQFLENLLHQAHQLNDLSQRMQDLYERSLLEGALSAGRGSGTRSVVGSGPGGGQHSTGAEFDALEMDRFTGFHTLSQEIAERVLRVREAAQDIGFMVEAFDEVVRSFQRITQGLQEGINSARMEPFSRVTDRLPRAVRNVALKCGKQVKLEIEGRDTLIDKMILEKLTDPMTHLVNNAIVHGIGLPAQRQAAGQSPVGKIVIRASHQGNQTVITVSDDGVGINPDRVKAKAIERGLITPEQAATMSKQDIYQLLFMPGFSTKDQADEFAGRGVGLDVVRQNLAEIRGTVVVDSELGKGTTFTIRLPLTLSISKSLPCVVSHARVAFPMDGVADVPVDVTPEMIHTGADGKLTLDWQGQRIPLRSLSELLHYGRLIGRGNIYGGATAQEGMAIVIVHSLGRHVAFQVDQVLNEQEVVIKQLTGPVKKPLGIAGATILGDGRIMMIADILELVDLALGQMPPPSMPLWQGVAPVEPETTDEPTVLIVDDSIVVREMLSMTFSNKGYRVEQARDGQEAWEKLRDGLPCDLMFCDIEMPRMDGLELLSKIRRDPNLKHLPIAMLTSRGAERHRQMAIQLGANAYFTKPYLEETLLEAARRLLQGESLVTPNR